MASITHLATGALCGAAYSRATSTPPVPAMAAFAAVAASPDLDFFLISLPVQGTPLEHRVMTHSLLFALVAGSAIGGLIGFRRSGRLAAFLGFVAMASHGIADALTDNGPGPRLLWPFLSEPIRFVWHPIPGTESFQEYFTSAAFPVVSGEALVCVPFLAAAALVLLVGRPRGARAVGVPGTGRWWSGLRMRGGGGSSDARQTSPHQ